MLGPTQNALGDRLLHLDQELRNDLVEIIDIDGGTTIPYGVEISYGNEVTSDEASWTGLLSFASSDLFLYPDSPFESMSASRCG